MDLLSTVRKSGSRGGVNFSWEDVANSSHRENYLGHSLKAPVGRWAKGRDLNWYAKAEPTAANAGETEEEKLARERREEIRRIKEAEEDAINRALGLPITPRNTSGANAVEVQGSKIPERTEDGSADQSTTTSVPKEAQAGELRRDRHRDSERHHKRRHRSRSRERGHGRDRERDGERHRNRSRDRRRDRSADRGGREHRSSRRSRSPERRPHRDDRVRDQDRSRSRDRGRHHHHRRRSQSPGRSRSRDRKARHDRR
ncbi:kinase phosphorylation protein-domain-containing protein [Sordaria brevicollis]|uniref:Kinase phosphorylation protein-domain-containing protein n=1 Tax=Sordaria brevicollis TaxID=83679 RepID=A0AAE0PPM7_SORBR|nr:kinase phosphorylation protein-domain-containing protein [Sordaria brevicollis]